MGKVGRRCRTLLSHGAPPLRNKRNHFLASDNRLAAELGRLSA